MILAGSHEERAHRGKPRASGDDPKRLEEADRLAQ